MKNIEGQRNVRVLLVEDSLPIRQRVRSLIEESGHATVVGEAGTVTSALALFREHQPDAVVLDLYLAEGTGYSVLEEIKQSHPACEVIVLTNFAIPEYQERCRILGADHFFEKSKDFERVPAVLARMGRATKSAGRILIADDEVSVGKALTQFFQAAGYECEWVPDATETIQALGRSRFDLLIADINMPGNQQLELMQVLPKVAPGLPAILLTGNPSVDSEEATVRLHAKACLVKPPDLAELKLLVKESIANHRVHHAVRRKWSQFQALSLDLNQQLAVPRNVAADPDEFQELENLLRALNDVLQAGGVNPAPGIMHVIQHLELVSAVRETICVLEKTKRSFKSRPLGILRARLESLVGGLGLESAAVVPRANEATGGNASAARPAK